MTMIDLDLELDTDGIVDATIIEVDSDGLIATELDLDADGVMAIQVIRSGNLVTTVTFQNGDREFFQPILSIDADGFVDDVEDAGPAVRMEATGLVQDWDVELDMETDASVQVFDSVLDLEECDGNVEETVVVELIAEPALVQHTVTFQVTGSGVI